MLPITGIRPYWHESALSREPWNHLHLPAALLPRLQTGTLAHFQSGALDRKLTGDFWVAPYVFQHALGMTTPLWLPVSLRAGVFTPPAAMALPWVLSCFLDPLSTAPYLGSTATVALFLSEQVSNADWKSYQKVADACLQTLAGPDWIERFNSMDYQLLPIIWLRAKTPMPVMATPSMVSERFMAAEPEMSMITSVEDASMAHQGHAALCSLDPIQRQTLHHLLQLPIGEIQAITTPIGTGKWALVADLIASEIVRTAIVGKAPPRIALYMPNDIQRNSALLTKPLVRGLPDMLNMDVPWSPHAHAPRDTTKAHAYFMEFSVTHLEQPIANLEEAVQMFHARVLQSHQQFIAHFNEAQKILDIIQKSNKKYSEVGGLEWRFAEVRAADQKLSKAYDKLTQAILYWEESQVANAQWSKWIRILPYFKNKLRDQIWTFYENHLKGQIEWEDDAFQAGQQLIPVIHAKMRALRSERSQLQRALAPLSVEMQSRDNLAVEWFQSVGIPIPAEASNGETQILAYLDNLRYETYCWATHYWEGRWLQSLSIRAGSGPDPHRMIDCHAMLYHAFMMDKSKHHEAIPVDWLLIDEAHQWSSAEASVLLDRAQRAIFFGDDVRAARHPCISRCEDEQIAFHYEIAEDDEMMENHSIDGVLSSGASAFSLAMRHSRLPGLMLTHQMRVAAAFTQYLNKNAYRGRLINQMPANLRAEPAFLGVHVKGFCSGAYTAESNLREAQTLVAWLKTHQKMIRLRHPGMALEDCICIVTPFSGQQTLLLQLLENTVPVWQSEMLPDRLWPIVMFSPVITLQQARPFLFDQQANLLHAAVMLAQERLIVVGDGEIFDESMHSPSGQLAKCIQAEGGFIRAFWPVFPALSANPAKWDNFQNYRAKLAELIKKAQREVVFVSPTLSMVTMEALGLVEVIYRAVNRLVSVQAMTTPSAIDAHTSHNALQAWVRAGVRFACVRQLYTSYIEVDGEIAYELSFDSLACPTTNWDDMGVGYQYDKSAVPIVSSTVLQPLQRMATRRHFKTVPLEEKLPL